MTNSDFLCQRILYGIFSQTTTIACLTVLFVIIGCDRQKYPILGRDAIPAVQVFENHGSSVSHWHQKGIKDGILIHLDAHDDIKRIAKTRLQELQTILSEKRDTVDENDYLETNGIVSDGNFIYAAAKLGIIKEVFWITPTAFFQESNPEELVKMLFASHGFLTQDIDTFIWKNKKFTGLIDDIPFTICEISELSSISEPVILSIDVDYVPVMAHNYDEKFIETINRTFVGLYAPKYRIQDVSVAYSVNTGHLQTCRRWVGDLIIDILKNPALAAKGAFPAHYESLQQAEQLYMMERYSELMSYLFPILEKDIYNPDILMYLAQALDGLGMQEQSMNCAEKACLNDKNFCYGLCELGADTLSKSGIKAAEQYFSKAYEMNPQMAHSRFILAQALRKAGKFDDAIISYNVFRKHYGPFPADLYLGQTYLSKGDKITALKHFNNGRKELLGDPYALTSFGDRGVIMDVVRFYELQGYYQYAQELRLALNDSGNVTH